MMHLMRQPPEKIKAVTTGLFQSATATDAAVHSVQDGSGDPAQKTHDLVVTTSEMAQQGDIVTIEGLMVANKDFGAGYKYSALLEDAVIKR